MPRTSVNSNVRYARDIDEKILRKLEKIIRPINPDDFSVSAKFGNGYEVTFQSIDELLDHAIIDARPLKRLSLYGREARKDVLVQESARTRVTVSISVEFLYSSFTLDIEGEHDKCTVVERKLNEAIDSSILILRSALYPRYYIDVGLVVFFLPAVLHVAIPKIFGIKIDSDYAIILQMCTYAAYMILKYSIFPRIQFNFGYGKKIVSRQRTLKAIITFLAIGAAAAIWQEAVIRFIFTANS